MAQANLLHNPVYGSLTGNLHSFRLFQQQCPVHPDPAIGIVIFILADDFFHGICQILVLPGTVFVCEIFIEALAAESRHSAVERDFPGNPAVLCLQSQKDHSLVFADFRRLAEKKAAYADYRKAREEMKELLTAKANIDRILELDKEQEEANERREKEAEQR